MQRKKKKKVRFYCCAYCSGDIGWYKRFKLKNRARRKFRKYPDKILTPDE